MEYNVGDRVKIKSIDWHNKNCGEFGEVKCKHHNFVKSMIQYCGSILTIIDKKEDGYWVNENSFKWTDEMIECLAEEETKPKNEDEKNGESKPKYEDEVDGEYYSTTKYLVRPSGYQFVDENGNVINATKIVLEKKKKEYPKTYEECCKVLDFCGEYFFTTYDEGIHLPENDNIAKIHQILKSTSILTKLIICRNAYWKIYGEENGLGKPWEPDWEDENKEKYIIGVWLGTIQGLEENFVSHPLTFPTPEIRDDFYENFKEEIEFCKELL